MSTENQKELTIVAPKGYEIDKEKSILERIIFKKKEDIQSYEDVAKKLFERKSPHYPSHTGEVIPKYSMTQEWIYDANNAPTKEQWEWLLALNKLRNTALVLNKGWKPNWNGVEFMIYYDHASNKIEITWTALQQPNVYFKTKELAQEAIKILGEEEIKTALGLYKK